jgi:hypothetical protein
LGSYDDTFEKPEWLISLGMVYYFIGFTSLFPAVRLGPQGTSRYSDEASDIA